MTEMDRRVVAARQSCGLLPGDAPSEGVIPTTPTTASVVAGIETQEALKLLHKRPDLPTLAGKGFFFNGLSHDSFVIEYERKEDCLVHDTLEVVEELAVTSDVTLGQLLEMARPLVGDDAVLEFGREMVSSLRCGACGTEQKRLRVQGKITAEEAKCAQCGSAMIPELTHSVSRRDECLNRSLREIGLPPYDILTVRSGHNMAHFEIAGDRTEALGECT